MKKIVLLVMLIAVFSMNGQKKNQKLKEYKASNGVLYKIGDVVKLGRGSGQNHRFVYVYIGGWGMSMNPESNMLPAHFAGAEMKIKKIHRLNYRVYKGVYFTVGGGNITNYMVRIEPAIESCEIVPCNKDKEKNVTQEDKYDKLRKLKKLLDDGILTKEEYEAEKKKLLNQ